MKPLYLAVLLLLAFLAMGCPPQQNPDAAESEKKPAEKSTAQTAIEGFTGKTAVEAGKRAEKQIEAISAQREQDMVDAFGSE